MRYDKIYFILSCCVVFPFHYEWQGANIAIRIIIITLLLSLSLLYIYFGGIIYCFIYQHSNSIYIARLKTQHSMKHSSSIEIFLFFSIVYTFEWSYTNCQIFSGLDDLNERYF